MASIKDSNPTYLVKVEKDPEPIPLTVLRDRAVTVNAALENSGTDSFLPNDTPAQLDIIYREELGLAVLSNNAVNSPQDLRTQIATTFKSRNDVTNAEALRAVDRYLEQRTLTDRSISIKNNASIKQEGGSPVGDSTFIATVTPTTPITFSDIRQNLENDAGTEGLQSFAHRPGNPPPKLDSGKVKDIFNSDKLKPQRHKYASLRIMKPSDGTESCAKTCTLEGFETLFQTNEFLLQSTTEQRQEKYQVVETFGEPIIFTFGARHEIYTYAGIFLNTENFQWKNKFLRAYDDIVRVTKTVAAGARAYLTYDDVIREGHILNLSIQHSISNLNHVLFTFNMYITDRIFIGGADVLDNDIEELINAQLDNKQRERSKSPILIFPGEALEGAGNLVSTSTPFKNFIRNNMFTPIGNILTREFRFRTSALSSGSFDRGRAFSNFPNMGLH